MSRQKIDNIEYSDLTWKPREGDELNRYSIKNSIKDKLIIDNKEVSIDGFIDLSNVPDLVSIEGTKFTAANMNRIEKGVKAATECINKLISRVNSIQYLGPWNWEDYSSGKITGKIPRIDNNEVPSDTINFAEAAHRILAHEVEDNTDIWVAKQIGDETTPIYINEKGEVSAGTPYDQATIGSSFQLKNDMQIATESYDSVNHIGASVNTPINGKPDASIQYIKLPTDINIVNINSANGDFTGINNITMSGDISTVNAITMAGDINGVANINMSTGHGDITNVSNITFTTRDPGNITNVKDIILTGNISGATSIQANNADVSGVNNVELTGNIDGVDSINFNGNKGGSIKNVTNINISGDINGVTNIISNRGDITGVNNLTVITKITSNNELEVVNKITAGSITTKGNITFLNNDSDIINLHDLNLTGSINKATSINAGTLNVDTSISAGTTIHAEGDISTSTNINASNVNIANDLTATNITSTGTITGNVSGTTTNARYLVDENNIRLTVGSRYSPIYFNNGVPEQALFNEDGNLVTVYNNLNPISINNGTVQVDLNNKIVLLNFMPALTNTQVFEDLDSIFNGTESVVLGRLTSTREDISSPIHKIKFINIDGEDFIYLYSKDDIGEFYYSLSNDSSPFDVSLQILYIGGTLNGSN